MLLTSVVTVVYLPLVVPFPLRVVVVPLMMQIPCKWSLLVEPSRWRFVEDEDEVPKSQKKHSKQVACSYARPSSKPCLHEVTIAGGWGQKSAREKRLEKLASKLGYLPGMPRMKGRLVVVLVRFSSGVQGWLDFDNYCGCWWK